MVSRWQIVAPLLLFLALSGACDRDNAQPSRPVQAAGEALPKAPDALPAEQTGGFDGAKAYEHVARIVSFGPRAPGSEGSRRAQEYLRGKLESFGCKAEVAAFEASTPHGRVRMANVIGKASEQSGNILLLLSHYDTKQLANVPGFVGANDGASSSGVLLELARLLCSPSRNNKLTPWIVFTDGEEAYVEWSETDSTYGSRQLAAQMALSGELKKVKAVILADLVGDKELRFKKEEESTDWLVDLVWKTGRELGYGEHFLDEEVNIQDDHVPFLKRGIPAVDLIDLDYPWWHTKEDTLDKISARSLGITGHVILETIAALERKLK